MKCTGVKKKKDQLQIESNPNVNWGVFWGLPLAWGHLYAVCPTRLERRERKNILISHLVSLSCWFIVVEQRQRIVEGLKPQDMRVNVVLTVNSRDKVLKGTAVQRQSSRPLPLLVLLNSLQDQLFLKRGNTNWLHLMQIYCLRTQSHAWRHM